MPLIESKLFKDWRLEWAQEKAGLVKEDVGFSKMLKFLERELDIQESADQSVERQQPSKHRQLVEKDKNVLPTASGLMALPIACTFCNDPHNPKQCSVSMSVEDRFKRLKEARACYRCPRSGYRMSACRFQKPCACGRRFHILQLCKTGRVKIPEVQKPFPVSPPSNTPNHGSWNPAASSLIGSTKA